jgi:hypothetical protein
MRIALAMAAFLLASQPAKASAFLFAMPPQVGFSFPGAAESVEIRPPNAGPDPAMMIAEFPFDFTIFDDAPASALETYDLSGSPRFEPDIATGFSPNVAVSFAGPARRAAGGTMGSGCAVYSISPVADLGGVLRIGVGSPGAGTWPWDDAGDNISSIAEEMQGGAVTEISGPKTLLPTGLILLGLGTFRWRQSRTGRRRRKVPGMRKSALPTARMPGQTNAGERYYAV